MGEIMMFIFLGLNLNKITTDHENVKQTQIAHIWDHKGWILTIFFILLVCRLGVVLVISFFNHFIFKCCGLCRKNKVGKKLQIKQNFTHDPFAICIMWFAGIFKGVIAFTLTLRYETRIMEIQPRQSDYKDEPAKYAQAMTSWLSLYEDMQNALYVIYGLVLFTNVFWGGTFPFLIKGMKKMKLN